MISEKIKNKIKEALKNIGLPAQAGVEAKTISLEHPVEISHGDYSTNAAMLYAKELKTNPKELAQKIIEELQTNKLPEIEKIELAGPGFINFYLDQKFFSDAISEVVKKGEVYGSNNSLAGQQTIIEYTDPNPFKQFHIGHLMSNTIGESIARIVATNGAEVKRACYQGDVGLHVAKAVWAMMKTTPDELENMKERDLDAKSEYLGTCYAAGAKAYNDIDIKIEIDAINKKIYDQTDTYINELYQLGRAWSLEYFEKIYKKLGTQFDFYFFESTAGNFGAEIVRQGVEKGIFEKSEGAIVFHGEKYDPALHTRVFVSSLGLPTYEAKELGLADIKFDKYPYDLSIVITGNEINEYFKVLLKAMSLMFPDLAAKTVHLSHGMLRLPTGKMSSRTGEVIVGEALMNEIEDRVRAKISEAGRTLDAATVTMVAVAALKYSILKQAAGRDIIFDFENSISFEGDSGPYLQYAYTRANSILEKAKKEGIAISEKLPAGWETTEVEKLLYRFPEVVAHAFDDYAPHYVATYLIDLARSFNTYYGNTQIVAAKDPASPYKLAITKAFSIVIKNGLNILGIQVPEKM